MKTNLVFLIVYVFALFLSIVQINSAQPTAAGCDMDRAVSVPANRGAAGRGTVNNMGEREKAFFRQLRLIGGHFNEAR